VLQITSLFKIKRLIGLRRIIILTFYFSVIMQVCFKILMIDIRCFAKYF